MLLATADTVLAYPSSSPHGQIFCINVFCRHTHTQVIVETSINLLCYKEQYLILSGDGDTPCSKLGVEGFIAAVQVDSFHHRELPNIQDILTINGLRLGTKNKERHQPVRQLE